MSLPFDLKVIDPGKDNASKYSQNLFRFLKKFEKGNRYAPTEAFITAEPGGYPHIYIGYGFDGDIIGAKLLGGQILSDGARTKVWSICGGVRAGAPLLKLDNFWDHYLKVGRCAIDPTHDIRFQCGDRRFEFSNIGSIEQRVCRWCGLREVCERWKEVVYKDRERWVILHRPDSVSGGEAIQAVEGGGERPGINRERIIRRNAVQEIEDVLGRVMDRFEAGDMTRRRAIEIINQAFVWGVDKTVEPCAFDPEDLL